MKKKLASIFVLLILAVLASACGRADGKAAQGEAVSALSREEAAAMIESAMQALNTGDYAVWSRDWDDAMKAAITEASFRGYRNQVLDQYGKYLSLESLEIQPGSQKGNVRWVAIAGFEKGKIKFSFGFRNDGRQITGIFPEALE